MTTLVDGRSLVSWSRRTIGLIAVGGLLVAAAVTYQLVPSMPSSAPNSAATSLPPSEAAPPTSAPSGADGTPSATSTSVPPSATETGLPDGPGVTEPGVLIVATPGSDESFSVVEMIRLPDPVTEVSLRPPPVTAAWGSDLADARPRAVQVQGTVGDQPLVVPDGNVTSDVSLPVAVAADTIVLRYRLEGTVVRTLPSTAGRALGAIAPLAAGPGDLPVVVIVSGDSVRNLTCPTRTGAAQLCATGDPPRLRTVGTLPWRDSLVIVQLDLAIPR